MALPETASEGQTSRQGVRFRLGILYAAFLGFFAFIGFRLVQLQIFEYPALTQLAERQYRKIERKFPYRVPIFDRNRDELAVSTPASSVFVRPKLVRNRREVARVFSKHLGGTPTKWLAKLKTGKSFVWVQRQVPAETAKKIASYKLKGVFAEPENRRIYPNGMLAASLLGFTDVDGKGISGIELSQNETILSRGEKLQVQRDGKGNPSYIDANYASRGEVPGAIYLTIDRRLQHAVEEELDFTLEKTNAKGAMAVVMDPLNGEIFAMAQRPSFDPNFPQTAAQANITNRLVSHLFEPGSTLKTLFIAEAIQTGLLTRSSVVDCGNGTLTIGKRTISEAESDHRFAALSLEKVLQYSSNIGSVRVAQMLGTDRVRSVIDKFGLTTRTGIQLPGEASASAKGDEAWVPFFLATVGFGQGISVTPLQMVAAYAPFANGGYLVRPKILLSEALLGESMEVRRVLSPATVQVIKEMLVGVTEGKNGTGAAARVPGVSVAGKTGTAQKYEQGFGYDSRKYFSSFIGFLPADQPQLLIGVMVDEPKNAYYASETAAPLFRRIAEKSLTILDKHPKQIYAKAEPPTNVAKTTRKASPRLSLFSRAAPAARPDQSLPASPQRSTVRIEMLSDKEWKMPDLAGLSLREAIEILGKYSSQIRVAGNGFLETQEPKAGSPFSAETSIQLKFSTNPSVGGGPNLSERDVQRAPAQETSPP